MIGNDENPGCVGLCDSIKKDLTRAAEIGERLTGISSVLTKSDEWKSPPGLAEGLYQDLYDINELSIKMLSHLALIEQLMG